MADQQFKLEVPAQIKEVAEKTIDQAERSFSAFIEAANKSVSMSWIEMPQRSSLLFCGSVLS